jgi:hypothetical protein
MLFDLFGLPMISILSEGLTFAGNQRSCGSRMANKRGYEINCLRALSHRSISSRTLAVEDFESTHKLAVFFGPSSKLGQGQDCIHRS